MVLVCGGAFVWGGRTERRVAVVLFLAALATPWLQRPAPAVQYGFMAIDLAVAAVLVAWLLDSRRRWLVWLTGFQLLSLATHLGVALDRRISNLAYFSALVVYTYAGYAALGVGVVAHVLREQARRRRHAEGRARALIAERGPMAAAEELARLAARTDTSGRKAVIDMQRAMRRLQRKAARRSGAGR